MPPSDNDITLKNLKEKIQQVYTLRAQKQNVEATEIVENCLKEFPQDSDLHCLRGLLQFDRHEYLEAEKSLNIAITLMPKNADYYFFLGQLLRTQKRLAEAENAYLQCLKINSQHIFSFVQLGSIFESRGRLSDAIRLYQKALKINPDFSQAHYNLGVIYHKQDKLTEAIASYESALKNHANDVVILSNLGVAFTKDRQFEKAIAAYEKALRINSEYVPALTNLGATYVEMNNFKKAEEFMRKALALDASAASNWRNLTLCVHYQSIDHKDAVAIKALMSNAKLPVEHKAHLFFALGKIYDDCDRYPEAFEYYSLGNKIRDKFSEFDPLIFRNHMTHLIKAFDKSIFKKYEFPRQIQPQPIIIVGTSRSGKSLIESILKQYPNICAAGEVGIAEYGAKVPIEYLPKGNYPFWVKNLTMDEANAIRNAYYQRLQRDIKKSDIYVMDTLPGNFMYLGLISILFPGAKIIFCRRNPLDVCLFMYFKYYVQGHGYSCDLKTLGAYYQQFERIMNHWHEVIPQSIFDLQYEELVIHPKETIQKLVDYLRIDPDFSFKYQFLSASEVGHAQYYQKYLTPLSQALAAAHEKSVEDEEPGLVENHLKDLIKSAYHYFLQGNMAAAERECQVLLGEDQNHYPALHLLGLIYFAETNYEKSLAMLTRAIQISPTVAQLHADIAKVYYTLGRQMESEMHLQRAETIRQDKIKGQANLTKDQRDQLLIAFSLKPEIIDEFETRLLIQGKLEGNLTTDSYLTRSWDQYFSDLSFGSFKSIAKGGKHAWRVRSWHFLFKNIAIIDKILNHPSPKIHILDIGCATGYFRRFLEGNIDPKDKKSIYYWGLDIREEALTRAVKAVDDIESGAKGNLVPSAFIIHDIKYGLPFQDSFFDYVVNFEMIKYLPIAQGKKLLAEIYRVLNANGELFLSTTYTSHSPGFMGSVPFEMFDNMLKQNGFKIIQYRGSQASMTRLAPMLKDEDLPFIKALLKVHPPEIVAAIITPLYPSCAEQVTFYCRID